MARRYTPPKKKKSRHQAETVRASTNKANYSTSAAPVMAIKRTPVPNIGSSASAIPEAVKYASLPRELRRVAILTAVAVVVLIVLWLILR